jgi:peptide chain release factor 1
MDAKIIKLQEIEKRYNEITDLLMQDEVVSDVKKYTKLSKEQAKLKASYDAYQNYKKYTQIVEDGEEMLKDDDPEIKEMAELEISEAKEKLEALDKHIEELLLPRDPEDSYDCLVEIRGAAGGDEGNIFAGDLFRMYSYYADSLGYKVEVMESSEGEAGGFALISFAVKGLDAYRHFKFESGAHRVQRVPKTETQGRVHTSTATVIVFPDVEDEDIEIPDSDL